MLAFPEVIRRAILSMLLVQAGSWAAFPQILVQPSDVQVHAGDTAVFQVVVEKADTLKWYVNDTLRGTILATNQSFSLLNVQLPQDKAKVH
ncbi:MAG TPA: immunoglobulin domain-containing protein, partial [Fibrobacteria bacterium]|nr:immunoglobulin domain-containing protein [Fibrobacteria bacterium]